MRNKRYSRPLVIGCLVLCFQQLSGLVIINQYAFYFRITADSRYGIQLVLSAISIFANLTTWYLVTLFGRKTLLLFGFMSTWACNILLFQVFDDDLLNDRIDAYSVCLNIMTILILILFTIFYSFGIGGIVWIYAAETMTPKAFGIGVWMHWISMLIVSCLPWIAVHLNSNYDKEISLQEYVSVFFFLFGGFGILAFFVVLVFVLETRGLAIAQLERLYDGKTNDTMMQSLKLSFLNN